MKHFQTRITPPSTALKTSWVVGPAECSVDGALPWNSFPQPLTVACRRAQKAVPGGWCSSSKNSNKYRKPNCLLPLDDTHLLVSEVPPLPVWPAMEFLYFLTCVFVYSSVCPDKYKSFYHWKLGWVYHKLPLTQLATHEAFFCFLFFFMKVCFLWAVLYVTTTTTANKPFPIVNMLTHGQHREVYMHCDMPVYSMTGRAD